MTRQPAVRLSALVVAMCLLAGCSGGSGARAKPIAASTTAATASVAPITTAPITTAPVTPAPISSAASAPTAASAPPTSVTAVVSGEPAPTLGPAPAGFITHVCSAITIADARATVQLPIDAIAFDPNNQDPDGIFACTIDPADQAVTVTVEPEDVAMANYESDVAAENVPATPLPGIGDIAVWTQLQNGPPDFYAHKGHVTCEVKTNDTQILNLAYDPSVGDGGVTAASAAAYAGKLGTLCNDVFAAIG